MEIDTVDHVFSFPEEKIDLSRIFAMHWMKRIITHCRFKVKLKKKN